MKGLYQKKRKNTTIFVKGHLPNAPNFTHKRKNLLENFHETDHSSLQSVALGFFIRDSR